MEPLVRKARKRLRVLRLATCMSVQNPSFFVKQQLSNLKSKTFVVYLVIGILALVLSLNYLEQVRKTAIILDVLGNRNMADFLRLNEDTTIMNPEKGCQFKGRNLEAVILITTLANSRARRETIRKTWVNWKYEHNVMIFFFAGTPKLSEMEDIQKEAKLHGDLIIEDLPENYSALSIKTLRMLKWFTNNCPKPKYLIKTDDDVFINVPNMLAYLRSVGEVDSPAYQNYIGGLVHEGRSPHTWNAFSKWYVPSVLWSSHPSSDTLPPYVGGPCYVLSAAMIPKIIDASLQVPVFNLEDVYVTGLIGSDLLHVQLQQIPNMYDAHYPRLHRYFSSSTSITSCTSYHTDGDMSLMYDLYDQILSNT